MAFKLVSSAFNDGGFIPERHSHKGGNLSPPLAWEGAPEGTKCFAIVVDDPDAPSGHFVHWLVYGIPSGTKALDDGQKGEPNLGPMKQGQNGFGKLGYGGPEPPSGTHRYFFHLYALDVDLDDLPMGVLREQLDREMEGHILKEAVLMGRYEHRKEGSRAA
jgi:Raf kinase inhibitor-like YbhB/YbcL family protein